MYIFQNQLRLDLQEAIGEFEQRFFSMRQRQQRNIEDGNAGTNSPRRGGDNRQNRRRQQSSELTE